MQIRDLVRRAVPTRLQAPQVTGAADARWSVVSSAHDAYLKPNGGLVDIALAAAGSAATDDALAELQLRCDEPDATWIRTWPGEHYRLLAALVRTQRPDLVIEVGTFKGHGALALAAGSPRSRVLTYDVLGWDTFADTALRPDDFAPAGRIEQRLGDLGDSAYRAGQLDELRGADLIFIDGPKDGVWEQRAVPAILADLTDRRRLVVFDDIRLMAMVQLWRDLDHPKLDLTSFGHWSGTGLLWTV